LLLEDLALDFALLPAYEAVIIDEAHKLPETGQTRLGREITFFRLKHILQMLAQTKSDASGLLAELERGAGIAAPTPAEGSIAAHAAAEDSIAANPAAFDSAAAGTTASDSEAMESSAAAWAAMEPSAGVG